MILCLSDTAQRPNKYYIKLEFETFEPHKFHKVAFLDTLNFGNLGGPLPLLSNLSIYLSEKAKNDCSKSKLLNVLGSGTSTGYEGPNMQPRLPMPRGAHVRE